MELGTGWWPEGQVDEGDSFTSAGGSGIDDLAATPRALVRRAREETCSGEACDGEHSGELGEEAREREEVCV
jgi:hypothetical protein